MLGHRGHVDAHLGKLIHDPVGARIVGFDGVPGHDAVVLEGFDGRGWHRVHGGRADQRLRVDNVAVIGILGAGARPQRSLHVCAGGAQLREALVTETLLEELVGEHRVGNRRLAEQAFDERVSRVLCQLLLEQLVDERVHAADEERGDRMHVE